MAINHGIHGGRTIVGERNGRTIVNEGRHGGYVQRPYFNRGGRSYYSRTYVRDGRTYNRVYRGYDYRGGHYYGYVPDHYYHPRFYGWAYRPWARPVYYGPAAWGWVGEPWYRAYPGYFTPFPVYAVASLWLTDYLIAANMRAAYQAGVEAGAGQGQAPPPGQQYQQPPPGPADATTQTPLSPEVKQAIADEVQQQLAAEQAAAQTTNPQPNAPAPPPPAYNPPTAPSGEQVPDALNPSERVFVVASSLDVTTAGDGQECGLTAGDVLMRLADTPDANQNVTASVQSSKKGDCAAGQTVAVSVDALQEMHNHFHEQLDSGLQTLASNSGKNGLPSAPDTGTTAGEVPAPPTDAGAADQLQAQQQAADQTEAQVQ
jgi:hypothetical protein